MNHLNQATAIAHPNIALIKYWGKADEKLIIPATGSLSMTLDIYPTTTTVRLIDAERDEVFLNSKALSDEEAARVIKVLELLREESGNNQKAQVISHNTVPTAAGLASSAAAFAALAKAGASAYGLHTSDFELSRIARRGSGSASRSIFGGLVRWNKGDDLSSVAESLTWDGTKLAMLVAVISSERKEISSRTAMKITAETSAYYPAWVEENEKLLARASEAVDAADFKTLGELTEMSAFRMHASMWGAEPPIRYLNSLSLRFFDEVKALRSRGLLAYATADAGPNVKILCQASEAGQIAQELSAKIENVNILIAKPGPGAYLSSEHQTLESLSEQN